MILYTCGMELKGPDLMHPCARAGRALTKAGYEFEIKTVKGYRGAFWTWRSRAKDRAEVRRLSGTDEVPVLALDDGAVLSGSGTIAGWAQDHPAPNRG